MKKYGQDRRRMVALFNLVNRNEVSDKKLIHVFECDAWADRRLPCSCPGGPTEAVDIEARKANRRRAVELDALRARLSPQQVYHAEHSTTVLEVKNFQGV